MARKSSNALRRDIHAVATSQGGYFTTNQAAQIGYDRRRLVYHVKARNFERAGHGLYRISTLPPSENDDLVRLSLWSRGRNDRPQAVVSHETALGLHGLSELIPSKTHLSVPKSFRKRPPKGCVLHKSTLTKNDWNEHEGFKVTTPLRTLLDVAASDTVPQEQLDKAVSEALERGLIRKAKVLDSMRGHPAEMRLSRSLRKKR
ncbi:MAG TPA: type IV toxin-antitoxin system AbiEi family antitoxin domain-containing protein [Phycisphaerae bacterium]|nr:type IV toxin-antitoxin system AbiEi family antitoxin domain-containing protein [Phycisphaerae bacterium]